VNRFATLLTLSALAFSTPLLAATPAKPNYPTAPRDKTVDTYFGIKVPAPYQWMENLNSPRLKAWVKSENALTQSYLAKIPYRGWMRNQLESLWNYTKLDTPMQAGGKLFFSRNSGLQNQSVVYVKDSASAKRRMLIDPNKLSKDGSIALAGYQPSPDGKYLSYELSQGGSDWQTIHVLDVKTGKDLSDRVHWVKFSGVSWTRDDKGFFYSRYPRPPKGESAISQQVVNQKLYYHRLGTPQSDDVLIYARPKLPRWIIEGNVSEDGRYLFVFLVNGTSPNNELFYADLGSSGNPDVHAKLKPLFTKNDAAYSPVGIEDGTLYLQTTLGAPRGRIVATPLAHPSPEHWRVVVPQAKGVLKNAQLAGGRILADYQVVAKSRLQLYSTQGKALGTIKLPTLGSVRGISARNDSSTVYYAFTSFLYPKTIYDYDVKTGKTGTFFKPKVNFNASDYATKQVFYASKDGTMVPMFIVARKGVKLDGRNPTVLYGYGGFNITITPSFNPMLPLWLKMGGVYAVPNLRGGGVYGEKWHEAGMLGNKQNVFNDFAWAAKYLIKKGYTSSAHLGIQGYSNGGLLTGASITQRPKLFGAAYIGHGVLDMLRYQKFSGGALWAPEYGTSNKKKDFKWLYAYSPLHNIKQGTCYPPTLITTSWDDDRVVPSHEFKFTAKIQRAQGCDNPILLHTTGSTSHIYMPTDKEIAQTVDVWAFEAWNLGVRKVPGKTGSQN